MNRTSKKSDNYGKRSIESIDRPLGTPDCLKITSFPVFSRRCQFKWRFVRGKALFCFSAHFATRPNKMTSIQGFRIRDLAPLSPIFPTFRKIMECKQSDAFHYGLLYKFTSLFLHFSSFKNRTSERGGIRKCGRISTN